MTFVFFYLKFCKLCDLVICDVRSYNYWFFTYSSSSFYRWQVAYCLFSSYASTDVEIQHFLQQFTGQLWFLSSTRLYILAAYRYLLCLCVWSNIFFVFLTIFPTSCMLLCCRRSLFLILLSRTLTWIFLIIFITTVRIICCLLIQRRML